MGPVEVSRGVGRGLKRWSKPVAVREARGRVTAVLSAAVFTAMAIAVIAPAASAQSRHAAIAVDGNTGRTLYAEFADEPRYPASLTKMMTIYLAFEQIERRRMSYSTRIKMSQEAASQAPSKLGLEPGESLTLADAIKALVTKSANDVAVAVGEAIAGSEAEFARQMTAKARQLGMTKTTFRNASGLPDPHQLSTARDMVTLAIRLHDDFPKHYGVFALRAFTFDGVTFRNHNTLLGSYEGMEGLKTGYTRMSGFNLVSSVKRGGRHVFAAVFGGESAGSRNATMRAVLNRTLLMASTTKTRRPEPTASMLVASARPAPRPVPRAEPRPVAQPQIAMPLRDQSPVAAPTSQLPIAPVPVAGEPARAPSVSPAPVPQPATAGIATASASPRIDIAQVRRVMVATRPRPAEPASSEEDAGSANTGRVTQFARSAPIASLPRSHTEARPPSTLERQQAMLAASASDAHSTSIAKSPSTRPSAYGLSVVETAQAAPMVAPVVAPAASPDGQVRRGMPPSTLQAQAAAIPSAEAGSRPRQFAAAASVPSSSLSRLAGPATPPAPIADGGYQLQIGAFGSEAEAGQALEAVRAKATRLLSAYRPVTTAVTKDTRRLFRARFAGFTAQNAASTCLELRRQQIDCFVMKAE